MVRLNQEYRPEIDGLRAFAVAGVILFHLKVALFQGGYSGVDVFFVISGYLITRNILHDVQSGSFSFTAFYVRRICRIFPALLATVAATFVAGVLWFPPDALRLLADSAAASLLSVSNIYFWTGTHNYFAPASDYLPLLHFWSLSVEEQFYLVWPLLLVLASRSRVRIALSVIVAAIAIVSLVEGQRWLTRDASAVFYLTPFRAYQFALGALVLFFEGRLRPGVFVRQALFALGVAMIAVAYCRFGVQSRIPSIAASLGAMSLIAAGAVPWTSAILTNRVAVGVGAISYSLYLCHWPVIVFANYVFGEMKDSFAANALMFIFTLLCSILLYIFVEKRFRHPRVVGNVRGTIRVFGAYVALVLVLVAIVASASIHDGWPWRLTSREKEINRGEKFGMFPCVQSHLNDCRFGNPSGRLGVVLIGDSYVEQYVAAFHLIAGELGLRGAAYTHGGCLGLLGVRRINFVDERACRDGRDPSLAQARADKVPVVIGQAWMGYALGAIGDDDGKPIVFATEDERLGILKTALEKTIRFLGGQRVMIIGAQVIAPCDIEAYRFGAGLLSHQPPRDCAPLPISDVRRATVAANTMLQSLEEEFPSQVTVLLPEDYLCEEVCHFENDGIWRYQDQGHLTVAGSEHVARRAREKIKMFLRAGRDSDPS